jgi:hypothetical protein
MLADDWPQRVFCVTIVPTHSKEVHLQDLMRPHTCCNHQGAHFLGLLMLCHAPYGAHRQQGEAK